MTRNPAARSDDGRVVVYHDERRPRRPFSVHVLGGVLCGGRGNRYFGSANAALAAGLARVSAIDRRAQQCSA